MVCYRKRNTVVKYQEGMSPTYDSIKAHRVKRGTWTIDTFIKILNEIKSNGGNGWRSLPKNLAANYYKKFGADTIRPIIEEKFPVPDEDIPSWTLEECLKFITEHKFQSKEEWKRGGGLDGHEKIDAISSYKFAEYAGWLRLPKMSKLFASMALNPDSKVYDVYVYDDKKNKAAYVGLTRTGVQNRHMEHIRVQDTIGKHIKKKPYLKPTTVNKEKLTMAEAQEMEDVTKKMLFDQGYSLLNKGKTGIGVGSVGGIGKYYLKFTDEKMKTLSETAICPWQLHKMGGEYKQLHTFIYKKPREERNVLLRKLFPMNKKIFSQIQKKASKYPNGCVMMKSSDAPYWYRAKLWNKLEDLKFTNPNQ